MSRLPCEPVRITRPPDDLPRYQHQASACADPWCPEAASETHHVVRRSFIRSWKRKDWVMIDGLPMRNEVRLCHRSHRLVTEGAAAIEYVGRSWWFTDGQGARQLLAPGHPYEPSPIGTRPAGSTSSWVVVVPEDAENGSAILDALVREARQQLGLPDWAAPYYVLTKALAAVAQGQA